MGANQSQLQMQQAAQALTKKIQPYSDDTFWQELWSQGSTPLELWSALPDSLLAEILTTQPANFAALLHKVVNKLAEVCFASKGSAAGIKPIHTFANTYTASILTGVAPPKNAEDPVILRTVDTVLLNCVRILTRCIAFLSQEPHSQWYAEYMWGGALPVQSPSQMEGVESLLLKGFYGDIPLGEAIVRLLMELLFVEGFTVHQSLATTIVNKMSLRHGGVQLDKLWEVGTSPSGGVVCGPPNLPSLVLTKWVNPSQGWSNFDSHRMEVLRCLLVCFGEPMFLPPVTGPASPRSNSVAPASFQPNRFLRLCVSESSACSHWTPTLCWSLLNIICTYHVEGTAALSKVLPYTSTLSTDYREPLMETALHFLLLVLDYRQGETVENKQSVVQPEERRKSVVVVNAHNKEKEEMKSAAEGESTADTRTNTPSATTPTSTQLAPSTPSPRSLSTPTTSSSSSSGRSSNVFHTILSELQNPACLTALYSNLCRLLLNSCTADATWMPHSLKKLHCFQELLVLMWKLADENPYFVPHILKASEPAAASGPQQDQCDILFLLTPILYLLNQCRKDESQLGLCYSCVFLLLKLSGDREFGVALNRSVPLPALSHLPLYSLLGIPSITNGTYADLLIVVSHKLIVSSPNHLDALLKVLLTLLGNVSPYITKLSLYASVKLLSLFELFSSPKFVMANPSNHQYAAMLIDPIFNNLIQYQYQGQANLVYSILRRAKLFQLLGKMEPDQTNEATGSNSSSRTNSPKQQQQGQESGSLTPATPQFDLEKAAKSDNVVSATIQMAESDNSPQPPQTAAGQTTATEQAQQQEATIVPARMPVPPASPPRQRVEGAGGISSSRASSSQTNSPSSSSSPHRLELSSSTAGDPSFVPTAAWKNSWKKSLQLEPISRVLNFFQPKVDAYLKNKSTIDETALLRLISETTLVGVLPVPHPIVVRRYIRNFYTNQWFSVYLAGVVFLRQQAIANSGYGPVSGAPLWNGDRVRLFVIQHGQKKQAQQRTQQTTAQKQPQPPQPSQERSKPATPATQPPSGEQKAEAVAPTTEQKAEPATSSSSPVDSSSVPAAASPKASVNSSNGQSSLAEISLTSPADASATATAAHTVASEQPVAAAVVA